MADLTIWAMIIALGLGTQATRLSFIVLLARVKLPRTVQRGLYFMPPAVLAAIIAPILMRPGSGHVDPDPARVGAALVAMGVAWKTRSTLLTVIIGMAALWILRLLAAL